MLLVDDLIATGEAEAAIKLIEKMGGIVVECCAVIDLPELGGQTPGEAQTQGVQLVRI